LAGNTKDWSKVSTHSLIHNTQEIRPILGEWGEEQIRSGTMKIWDKYASAVKKPKELKDVNLWMDSTDFPLETPVDTPKSHDYWSYKCNKLGRRFQAVFDGKTKCRALWGGYSPKIYDSHWCEVNRRGLETTFKGATIIADQHYQSYSKKSKGLRVITPIPERKKRMTKRPHDQVSLTEKQIKRNKRIRTLRARVENPFGKIDNKWKSLTKPWKEDPEQLDALVFFAVAVLNKNIK